MGIFFVNELTGTIKENLRCLFCERAFGTKRILDVHYLTDHEQAFTEEELKAARSRHSQRLQDIWWSPAEHSL